MILREDVTRNFVEHAKEKWDDISLDIPGEYFSPERAPLRWIEIRFTSFIPDPPSGSDDEEFTEIGLQIKCYVVSKPKGKLGDLDRLVDRARAVVDFTSGTAVAIPIFTREKKEVGQLQFRQADDDREYGISVIIDEVEVKGVDVATLTISAILTGDP